MQMANPVCGLCLKKYGCLDAMRDGRLWNWLGRILAKRLLDASLDNPGWLWTKAMLGVRITESGEATKHVGMIRRSERN